MPYADPEKRREAKRKYAEANREKVRESQKKSYYKNFEKNKDKIRERSRKYHDEHRDELNEKKRIRRQDLDYHAKELEYKKKYREEHLEEHREYMKKWHEENNNAPAKYDAWFEKISPYYEPDQIRRDPDNSELIQFKCHLSSCENWVNPTYEQLTKRYRSIVGSTGGENNIYCSDECKQKCPVFGAKDFPKGFKPKIDYSREAQPELREMVLKRDNYTCQKCGKSKKEFPDIVLHCHHKFPLNEDPVCSADIDNCITLCVDCHKWVHKNVPGCNLNELKCSS